MEPNHAERIQAVVESTGVSSTFNLRESDEIDFELAEEFELVEKYYNQRYGSARSLIEMIENNHESFIPFLQSIGLPLSVELRTVIARLCEGREILSLELKYNKGRNPSLYFQLSDEPNRNAIVAEGSYDLLILPQLGYTVTNSALEFIGIRPWDPKDESI